MTNNPCTPIAARGYLIRPNPQRMADGTFGAGVIIQRDLKSRVDEQRFDAQSTFATEDEACEEARKLGLALVDGSIKGLII